jgi:hypothetical protein
LIANALCAALHRTTFWKPDRRVDIRHAEASNSNLLPRPSLIHHSWASRPKEDPQTHAGRRVLLSHSLHSAACSTHVRLSRESQGHKCAPSSLFELLLNGLECLAHIWCVWEKTNGGVIFQPRGHTDADLGIGGGKSGLRQGYGRAQLREAKPKLSPGVSSRSSHFRGGRVYRGVKETLSATYNICVCFSPETRKLHVAC